MANNKITSSLNVAEGSNRAPGRKYGLDWATYQAVGGYQGAENHRHKIAPSDKALENSYQRKVVQWGVSQSVPKAAKIDVAEGSMNRGNLHGSNNTR